MEWIIDNYKWIIGTLITIGAIVFRQRRKRIKNKAQSIKGNNNIQAGRDINIGSEKKERPRINIQVKGIVLSTAPVPFPDQDVITVSYERINEVMIKNESANYAYNCKVNIPNDADFEPYVNGGNIGTIKPHAEHVIRLKTTEEKEVSSFQHRQYKKRKYLEKILPFHIRVDYEDGEGNTYKSTFDVDEDGNEQYS